MIISSQFEFVSMQFHHRNLTFYPNYVIISLKILEISQDFRKKISRFFWDKMRFIDTFENVQIDF